MKPRGKCFAKKCEDCNWWQDWDITVYENGHPTGLRKIEKKCSLQVMCETLPKLIGSIDGLQGGVNEARNRSYETQEVLKSFGNNLGRILTRGGRYEIT